MFQKRDDYLKNRPSYFYSLISLVVGLLLMMYLRRVYFVGLLILFILIVFQTPTTKIDRTGEANDASIAILKFIGLNTILYLVGGYAALIFF